MSSMPPPNAAAQAARGQKPESTSSSSSSIVRAGLMPPPSTLLPTPSTVRGGGGGTRAGERAKVALKPGRSPLDWAALRASGDNLRGVDSPLPLRVTKQELKLHNTRDDCWTALRGRVYNISAYMEYHPGGEKELMRGAGRDCTRLFELTHAWVNFEHMLDKCLIGFLVD